MLSARFLSFGSKGLSKVDNSIEVPKKELVPTLKLHTDKDVYRPGDSIVITIEISNPSSNTIDGTPCSLLVEKLSFEIKGIEKLDTQWYATQRPLKGSKQRRGEHVFMDCSTPSIISSQIVSSGATKTYAVQTLLPSVIPPSYRGATIRYLYCVKITLSGRWLRLENGHSRTESMQDRTELEARIPLQVWVTQKSSGLLIEEGPLDGIVPITAVQMNIYWKEMDGDSDWTRLNDIYDGVEDDYDSSRDEISSVSSYNPTKESNHKNFGSSVSVQSFAARSSIKDASYLEGGRTSLSSNVAPPQLSVAEVLDDSTGGTLSVNKLSAIGSPRLQRRHSKPLSADDVGDRGVSSEPGAAAGVVEPAASEGFIRGRSYNIKLDDQVLLRFSPKNSDSTYYFSDMIGGTLTFFHEEGARRCLEISVTLEISETISRRSVHPSRRNSPTITKVQSDHHEVVADLIQTSFIFSIPMDGPMSFSTPNVSVQWALRFEFFTTPKNVDWTRYEHPLMIEGRDRSDWVLPITVHAPPPGASAGTHNKSLPLEPLWVRT